MSTFVPLAKCLARVPGPRGPSGPVVVLEIQVDMCVSGAGDAGKTPAEVAKVSPS